MPEWNITFDDWYNNPDREEWWHDNYEALKNEWMTLEKLGVHREIIAKVFDNVIEIIREEYGD